MSPRVLVADDEAGIRLVLSTHLRRRGWEVDEAVDGTAALEFLAGGGYDAVVLDQKMPGFTGLEIARRTGCDPVTFIFSAYLDPQLESEAEELGCASISKTDIEGLLAALDDVAGASV